MLTPGLIALTALLASPHAASFHAPPLLARDGYGVPHISAPTWDEAFFDAGYAVAQDRLWQMENSRRVARGRMAEVFGHKFAAADKQVLASAYTEGELKEQLADLSSKALSAIENYAKGVNAYIHDAEDEGKLPSEYSQNGFKPEPWTVEDSECIAIWLFQLFGRGGAGELRNMAFLTYLGAQPNAKDKVLDVFDDMAWQNDPAAIPTLPASEDTQLKNPPLKAEFNREVTKQQLARLPKLGLFELLPAIQLAQNDEAKRVAEASNVPFRTGSYCIVVGPGRSSIGAPLLLSGPQMGFSNPSIIHEMSIEAPGVKVCGMDVPGVPGVVIGMTPKVAWGLTSGVADTEDIFDFNGSGPDSYLYAGSRRPIETIHELLKVKGEPNQTVDQQRTMFGPVVLHAQNHFFVRRSAYRGVELQSYQALLGLYAISDADQVDADMSRATMNFNFFFVMSGGDFGWRYLGRIPIRAPGIDPRLPTPADPKYDWRGYLSPDQLPHIRNPKAGILANWNNKPAAWWPNYDTPVWGRIFRNETLLAQVKKPLVSSQDLELAAWNIARLDETTSYFTPYCKSIQPRADLPNAIPASRYLKGFDGRMMQGSIGASLYLAFLSSLRTQIFLATTGNFVSPALFHRAIQPSVILKALERKTHVNYLGKRTPSEVVQAAFDDAVKTLNQQKGMDIANWVYDAGGIAVPGQPPIPYSDRGSYIQVIEMLASPRGRNVLPPGEAESGEHSEDQVPLARAWTYKPMSFR